jgi:hypothetical protein
MQNTRIRKVKNFREPFLAAGKREGFSVHKLSRRGRNRKIEIRLIAISNCRLTSLFCTNTGQDKVNFKLESGLESDLVLRTASTRVFLLRRCAASGSVQSSAISRTCQLFPAASAQAQPKSAA